MKDRLIELLNEATFGVNENTLADYLKKETIDRVADYLLANGVIMPPYKVGQMVYVLRSKTSNGKNLYLREEKISHYRIFERAFMCFESERLSVSDYLWNTTVFLTKEEAEKALAERRGT